MKKILLIAFLASMPLFACGGKATALEISDPQQPIEVDAGSEFTIVLESNPTTGYHWDIMSELDQSMVEFVKNEYTSVSDPNLVGGGGLDTWTFKAVKTGEAHITLGYYPPSNDPVDPQHTTTFTVIVK
jgi:inhibitor of cysteine peptidase